jgi:riboflavin synthase
LFTGIIEETGSITGIRAGSAAAGVTIRSATIPATLATGESVAVNGVCLTVVQHTSGGFSCDLSPETLKRSSFAEIAVGRTVNLERPLAVGGRLGGHFVLGHVDGVGRLIASGASGSGALLRFSYPAELERYLVSKGSIAVDGVSLTIAELDSKSFSVAVIPHTLRATNLAHLKPGDAVNLETDILAKYFERFFVLEKRGERPGGLTIEYLKEQGY